MRSGSSSTSTSARRSSFSRQLHAEIRQEDDRAGERDEAADDPAWMPRLADRDRQRPAEQDQHATDEPGADHERRQEDDEPFEL